MKKLKLSIRNQLLFLGALAVASIWTGALLQYLNLRDQSQRLHDVRDDLKGASRFSELARQIAQERGLSNGWLASGSGGNPAELSDTRARVDAVLASLYAAGARAEPAIDSRTAQLARYRAQIDRREIPAPFVFSYYTGLIGAVQDSAAVRLRSGMVQVGLSYEHLNHLQRATELLAQVRGLVNGALRGGALDSEAAQSIGWQLTLHREYMRLYAQAVPDDARLLASAWIGSSAIREASELPARLLRTQDLGAIGLDAAGWWTLATQAVDTLQLAFTTEQALLVKQAEQHIRAIEDQLTWTVIALVVLGVVTLGLVLATVGRIVFGLSKLLDALDNVGSRRNFEARIDDSRSDEFGIISVGINRLIAIAGQAVQEQEALSLIDALTGVLNRRGFDQQIIARTTRERAHRVPLCLVMIDLDHFKAINDTLGHASGDLVLRELGSLLRMRVRPDDVVARFGGEEFALLLPGCLLAEATAVAEKLRAALAAHDFGIGRNVTASFGVARWHETQTPLALIECADANLYRAKAAGRNRVVSSAPSEALTEAA